MGGGGIWGHGGCPHTHTHAVTCTHTHIYTCIEIANGRRHGMFNMHVRACVRACACACMHACMRQPPTHPCQPPPHPPIRHPPRGVDPRNHLKFNNTSTYQDISIPFEDLKSVKNSPPMGGCVVWWVGGWLGGLMGGVRSNH